MKILFITRSTAYTSPGGDTVQIVKTAEALSKLGVDITIKLTSEQIDYRAYDLIHYFNVIRPADMLGHIKRSKKPYVISPIFVDYSEYDSKVRIGSVRLLYKLFSSYEVEYLKTIARFIKNNEPIGSLDYLIKGQRKSIMHILQHAKCLLPNSKSEYSRLSNEFSIIKPFIVVPNAIDPSSFSAASELNSHRKNVLCVARFEGLKNQLSLIEALNGWDIPVKLVGKPSANQQAYYDACKAKAKTNIYFINHLPQDQLPALYNESKVHVLPSWFETTGLSSLEAAAMGCNIVISDKGDQKEYFKEYAFYCDPASPESIAEQVKLAYSTPVDPALRQHILENYTWEKAAAKTLEGYQLALNK